MARSASSISRRNGWSRSALWSSRDASSRTPWLRSSPRMLNCWRSGVDSPRKRGPRRSERTTIQHPGGTPERLTMGLTLNEETSNRVSEVVLPPRLGRNEACHCGSGIKYKRCCWEQDEALRRQLRGAVLPAWIDDSRSKLRQFEKYVCNVFALPDLFASLVDTRRAPKIPTFDVVNSLFHTAVLRIPSINALEGDLKEEDFQKLIGRHPTPDVKAFSADVVANVLDKLHLDDLHGAVQDVIHKAERNKAFRDGCYSALRCVAMDGWEPFASYDRHCSHCFVRKVKVKRRTGELEEVDQYYHRYVAAMLLGAVIDVVLGIEPLLNEEARRDIDSEHVGHEGELTAARRYRSSGLVGISRTPDSISGSATGILVGCSGTR